MHRKCVRSIYVEEAAAKTSSYGDFIWCSITVLRKERAKHSQFLAQLFLHMHLNKYFKKVDLTKFCFTFLCYSSGKGIDFMFKLNM